MAKKTTTIAVSSILLVALVGGLLFYQPFGGQVASSAACPSGMVVHQVSNAGSGALSVLCQSGGSGSYTYATCVSNQYVYGNATTGFLCSQIKYDQLAGTLYSTCASGSFATGNGSSTTLPCSSVNYDQLSGSLSCSSGYVLVSISTVATCVPVAETETGTTTLYVDLTNGNDATCTGTSSSPCKTITGALALLPTVLNYATTVCVSNGNDSEAEITFTHFLITASLTIAACTTSNVNLYYNGGGSTVGGSTSTLTDSSASWATNQFAGGRIYVYEGTGGPEFAEIASNTATTITIDGTWTAPASGSYYAISSGVMFEATSTYQFVVTKPQVNIVGFGFKTSTDGVQFSNFASTVTASDGVYDSYFYVPASDFGIVSTTFSSTSALFDYFILGSDSTGMLAETQALLTPRSDAFVSLTGSEGTGVYCTRASFCQFSGSAGSLDLFDGLSVGIEISDSSQQVSYSSQTFTGCTMDVEWPASVTAGIPSYVGLVAIYPSGTTGVVAKTSTVSNAISYTPLAQTGVFLIQVSVNIPQFVSGTNNPACVFCQVSVILTYTDPAGNAQSVPLQCSASSVTATTLTTTIAATYTITTTSYAVSRSSLTTTVTSTNNQLNSVRTYVTTTVSTAMTSTTTKTTTSTTATTMTQTTYSPFASTNPINAWGLYTCSDTFSIGSTGTAITLSFDTAGSISYYPSATLEWVY